MKLKGTLQFRDMGAGAWALKAEDGAIHDLDVGAVPAPQLEKLRNQQVVIEAREGGPGFGMMGSASWVVESITHPR
jgi:hypothetical protein